MGKVRAVAATLVSVVVFVSLLMSNLLLFYAENQKLWMASVASLERDESAVGMVLIAQGVYSTLGGVQEKLIEDPPRCTSWNLYADSLSLYSRYAGSVRAVHYEFSSESGFVDTGALDDNLSLIYPFNGYSPGSLNLGVRVYLEETSGGLPSYVRSEYHYVHLPISLSKMLSFCLSLLRDLQMGGLGGSSCDRVVKESRVSELNQRYSQLAASSGLSFALWYSFLRVDSCWIMYYVVTLSESSVEGVSGKFAWHLFDSGTA